MDGERVELTPAQQQYILCLIRSGTFPRVAVETAGLLWPDFRRWRRQERRDGRERQVREFHVALRQAAAQSRAKAELAVREESPLHWLKHGPGRDRPGYPGWGALVKPLAGGKKGDASGGLDTPGTQAVLELVLERLWPFPEAKASLAAALDPAGGEPATSAGGRHSKSSTAGIPAARPTDDASPTHA